MNLYLSSFRLGDCIDELLNLAGNDLRFVLIPNALDFIEDNAQRQAVIDRGISDLETAGFQVKTLDLQNYFENPFQLAKDMKDCNRIFVTGGNVFVLRRAMFYSRLDEVIMMHKSDANFVYAGYSAGSCICAPSLKGLRLVDDPALTPPGYKTDVIYSGLSLIATSFIPHFKSNHHESEAISQVVEYCVKEEITYRTFSDGEVLIEKHMMPNKALHRTPTSDAGEL